MFDGQVQGLCHVLFPKPVSWHAIDQIHGDVTDAHFVGQTDAFFGLFTIVCPVHPMEGVVVKGLHPDAQPGDAGFQPCLYFLGNDVFRIRFEGHLLQSRRPDVQRVENTIHQRFQLTPFQKRGRAPS